MANDIHWQLLFLFSFRLQVVLLLARQLYLFVFLSVFIFSIVFSFSPFFSPFFSSLSCSHSFSVSFILFCFHSFLLSAVRILCLSPCIASIFFFFFISLCLPLCFAPILFFFELFTFFLCVFILFCFHTFLLSARILCLSSCFTSILYFFELFTFFLCVFHLVLLPSCPFPSLHSVSFTLVCLHSLLLWVGHILSLCISPCFAFILFFSGLFSFCVFHPVLLSFFSSIQLFSFSFWCFSILNCFHSFFSWVWDRHIMSK